MTRNRLTLLALTVVLTGCITSRITTVWKAEPPSPVSYHKIMVAGIFEQRDDSLRAALENEVADRLSNMGYYAVSSMKEFGPYGLKSLNEEATYLTMCDNGIDAVLTFALVEESYAKTLQKGTGKKYTSLFYYNRIWNYRQLQQQAAGPPANAQVYNWEAILFDLATLQPQSVMQTGSSHLTEATRSLHTVANKIIKKMVSERVIKKQGSPFVLPKPF